MTASTGYPETSSIQPVALMRTDMGLTTADGPDRSKTRAEAHAILSEPP